jgi:hypothetical protein
MLKARIFLTLGVWTAVLPYLGFPYYIKNILFLLTGLCLMYMSLVMYKEVKLGMRNANKHMGYEQADNNVDEIEEEIIVEIPENEGDEDRQDGNREF